MLARYHTGRGLWLDLRIGHRCGVVETGSYDSPFDRRPASTYLAASEVSPGWKATIRRR